MATPETAWGDSRCITYLRARLETGQVRLSCYKTNPFFDATADEPADSVVLRIRRLATPAFRFERDDDEFFDGLHWRDAELIFEGVIPAVNNRKYDYMDRDVVSGGTYAYWVSTNRESGATGPATVRVRDPQIWWPWNEIDRRLEKLAANHPQDAELLPVGHTAHNRPLRALRAGRRDYALVLIGAVHPGESGPELMLPAVEHLLDRRTELLERVGLAVLPSVCADERERLALGYPPYLRVNSNGVDLNRNFPSNWEAVDYLYGMVSDDPDSITYRGPAPASEPETQAVMALCEQVTPAAVLSYHHLGSLAGSRFVISSAAADDKEHFAFCTALNRAYRRGMAPDDLDERPVVLHSGCTGGSLPTWAYDLYHVPACDLESDGSPACVRSRTDQATSSDMVEQQQKHLAGLTAVLELLAQ